MEDYQQKTEKKLEIQKTTKKPTVSRASAFLLATLFLAVGFVAGTRQDELYAAIAPVFGIRASADSLDLRSVQQVYRELKANYDGNLDKEKLIDGASRGLTAAAGDTYTVFMDKKEAEEFDKDLSGEFSGIGAEIGRRLDQPTVIRVIAGSPADKAGLKAGDVFVAVNSDPVDGKNASEVAEKVRGEEGTSVKLTMKRSGETKEYTIIRQKVNDASVRSEVRDGVGIMTISRFDNDTGSLARKAAEDFTTKNVKAVVLDLRDNGGGYVDAAQDVASLWLKDKVVVVEKTGDTVQDTVRTRGTAPLEGIKTIVLVNGASASASEIVAGALQDYEAATLYGEKTFGKGTVQQVISLSDGRRLKVTVARWYTPHGVNISKNGIKPNKEVTLSADDVNNSRDPQMNAALEVLR